MSPARRGGVALVLALVLGACTGGPGDTEETGNEGGGDTTITAAIALEWRSYNNNTAEENTAANEVVLNQVLRGFWYFDGTGAVTPDTELGTYEKTGDDPLTVRYTFAEDARWSDGEPLDCDDLLLAWAANSGGFGGVFSTGGSTGYDLLVPPVCEDGARSVEVVYTEPFADWPSLFGPGVILPAHVVEERAGVPDLVAAVTADDRDALAAAAAFYNDGWVVEGGRLDRALLPSAGPYRVDTWEPGVAVRLVENPAWWGTPAATPALVLRFIPDTEQAAALLNGEVQVIAPTPTVDTVRRLEGQPGVTLTSGDLFAYDHLDVNYDGPLADPDLREAFASCVPRQLIVDNLVRPVNAEAAILNSRWYFPQSPHYDHVVEASYDGRYDSADPARARQLVEAAGGAGTVVRIGYWTGVRRWANVVDLIADSCADAGLEIRHAGSADFFETALADRNFDVALFAWIGSPLITSASPTFTTGGGNNNGGYSNPQVDALVAQVDAATDPQAQADLVARVESILWSDLPTIPLFAWPGMLAHAADVEGPTFQPAQTGLTWNAQEWRVRP